MVRSDKRSVDELLDSLHTVDWLGCCAIGFGIAAGFSRGIMQQFSRLLVIATALLAASPVAGCLAWLANSADLGWPQSSSGLLIAESVSFLLCLPATYLVRRLLNGFFGSGAHDFSSRFIGSILGLLTGILLFVGAVSSWTTLAGHQLSEERFVLRPLCESASSVLGLLPEHLEPNFVHWDVLSKPPPTK